MQWALKRTGRNGKKSGGEAWDQGLGQGCVNAWESGFYQEIHEGHWGRNQDSNNWQSLNTIVLPEIGPVRVEELTEPALASWEENFCKTWGQTHEQQRVNVLLKGDVISSKLEEKYWIDTIKDNCPKNPTKPYLRNKLNLCKGELLDSVKLKGTDRAKKCEEQKGFACKGCRRDWEYLWDRS